MSTIKEQALELGWVNEYHVTLYNCKCVVLVIKESDSVGLGRPGNLHFKPTLADQLYGRL